MPIPAANLEFGSNGFHFGLTGPPSGENSGFKETAKVFRIVASDAQCTLSEMDDDTRPAPNVPNPPSPDAHVNAPAIQKKRAPGFHFCDIPITDRPTKKGYGTKTDR